MLDRHIDFVGLAKEVDAELVIDGSGRGGRPPYATEQMIRLLVLQQLYNLSDDARGSGVHVVNVPLAVSRGGARMFWARRQCGRGPLRLRCARCAALAVRRFRAGRRGYAGTYYQPAKGACPTCAYSTLRALTPVDVGNLVFADDQSATLSASIQFHGTLSAASQQAGRVVVRATDTVPCAAP